MRRGFPTMDGVHMGPCEIHKQHAHTIGPDGSLYACPGFAGEAAQSTGHIDGRDEQWRGAAAAPLRESSRPGRSVTTARSSRSAPAAAASPRTPSCSTCTKPNCHKTSFEAGAGHAGAQGGPRPPTPALAG